MTPNKEGNIRSEINEKSKVWHLIEMAIFIINVGGKPRSMTANAYMMIVLLTGRL